MEDTRTTAARTGFGRWSEPYENDSAARWLRVVIADANRRHPAVFALDLALRVAQPSHAGFRSPGQLMRSLCAAGFSRVSYCTIRWRSYAFVRGEKPS